MIHLAGHISELARDGDYVRLPIGADDVVVMRDQGKLIAFDNVCPHRGMRIYDGIVGSRAPVCGYHGRRLKPDQCMQRYLPLHVGDWVMVRTPGDPPCEPVDFEGAPGEAIDALLKLGPLQRVAMRVQPYHCSWDVAVENALDWTHVGTVHPGSLGRLGIHPVDGGLGPSGSSVQMFRAAAARALDRLQPHNPLPCDYMHLYLAPYSCVSSTRGLTVSVQHYLPAGPNETLFVTRLYASDERRGLAGQAHQLNSRVFDEDAAICARVPSGFVGREPLGPDEWRIAYFRHVWLRQQENPAALCG